MSSEFVETSKRATSRKKVAYLLPLGEDCPVDQAYSQFVKMADLIEGQEPGEVRLTIGKTMNRWRALKILEITRMEREVKISVASVPKAGEPEPGASTRSRRARPEVGVVTIRQEGVPYAELVKRMREQVDVKQLGVKVNSIRKTRGGDVIITTAGGAKQASLLGQEIRSKVTNCEVVAKAATTKQFFVYSVEASVTDDKLTEELSTQARTDKDNVKLIYLRPGKFGDCSALVEMPRSAAETILALKRVKVG